MDEHYEYTVIMPRWDDLPHTRKWGTFEEAQAWIQDAYNEGITTAFEIFYVAERKVSGWYRVDE